MSYRLCVLVPVLLAATGCATSPGRRDAWDYVGPDAALRGPPGIDAQLRQSIIDDRGVRPDGVPSETIQQRYRDAFEQWRQRNLAAMDEARQACVRETGDSGRPSIWSGYPEVFIACMRTHGYVRARGSDPL